MTSELRMQVSCEPYQLYTPMMSIIPTCRFRKWIFEEECPVLKSQSSPAQSSITSMTSELRMQVSCEPYQLYTPMMTIIPTCRFRKGIFEEECLVSKSQSSPA
jgi:hypothetical protein